MNEADNGLTCSIVVSYYTKLCTYESGQLTTEQAATLKKELQAIRKSYYDYGVFCKDFEELTPIPDYNSSRLQDENSVESNILEALSSLSNNSNSTQNGGNCNFAARDKFGNKSFSSSGAEHAANQYEGYRCHCMSGTLQDGFTDPSFDPKPLDTKKALQQIKGLRQNYYTMKQSGDPGLSPLPSKCNNSSNSSSNRSRSSFKNTVLFGDSELAQLENLAKQSGNENFIYTVQNMQEFNNTAKIARSISPDYEEGIMLQNTFQIANIFLSPLKKKLEEEAAAEKKRAKEITDKWNYAKSLAKQEQKQKKIVEYLIISKYLLYFRVARLTHLYLNKEIPKREDYHTNLIDRYQEFPVKDTLFGINDNVLKLIAKEQMTLIAGSKMINMDEMIVGTTDVSKFFTGEEAYKELLNKSKYTKNLWTIFGENNPILANDYILELKNSELPQKNEYILKFINGLNDIAPSVLLTVINAVEKDYLQDVEKIIERNTISTAEYSSIGISIQDKGKAPKAKKTINRYGEESFLNVLVSDIEKTLYENALLLRKGKTSEVKENYYNFLQRFERVTRISSKQPEKFLNLFSKEKSDYFKTDVTPIKPLNFLFLFNDLILTAVDAELEDGNRTQAKKIIAEYSNIILPEFTSETNLPRLALGRAMQEVNKKGEVSENTYLPTSRMIIAPRMQYYWKLLGVGPANSNNYVYPLYDLDRTHYNITAFQKFLQSN